MDGILSEISSQVQQWRAVLLVSCFVHNCECMIEWMCVYYLCSIPTISVYFSHQPLDSNSNNEYIYMLIQKHIYYCVKYWYLHIIKPIVSVLKEEKRKSLTPGLVFLSLWFLPAEGETKWTLHGKKRFCLTFLLVRIYIHLTY